MTPISSRVREAAAAVEAGVVVEVAGTVGSPCATVATGTAWVV